MIMKNKAISLICTTLKKLALTSLSSPSRSGYFQKDNRKLKEKIMEERTGK